MTSDILELQRAFTAAELNADTARLDELLADDFSRAIWRGAEMSWSTRVSQTWVEGAEGWRLAGIQFSSLDPASS